MDKKVVLKTRIKKLAPGCIDQQGELHTSVSCASKSRVIQVYKCLHMQKDPPTSSSQQSDSSSVSHFG